MDSYFNFLSPSRLTVKSGDHIRLTKKQMASLCFAWKRKKIVFWLWRKPKFSSGPSKDVFYQVPSFIVVHCNEDGFLPCSVYNLGELSALLKSRKWFRLRDEKLSLCLYNTCKCKHLWSSHALEALGIHLWQRGGAIGVAEVTRRWSSLCAFLLHSSELLSL